MNFTFDTQQVYRTLADKGGFSQQQADILIDVLRDVVTLNIESLATKDDVTLLRSEMKIMQQQLTIRLGSIMVVGVGVLAALMQFLG